MLNPKPLRLKLLPLMLVALLTGCAFDSPSISPPSVKPPAIPVLPDEARVSKIRSTCSPDCSTEWARTQGDMLPLPIGSGSPGVLAKEPTTLYSLPLGKPMPKP
jgi:hypothetical protein